MGFLKTMKVRMTVGKWAYDQLGVTRQMQGDTFNWAMNHGDESPENARRVGRLVEIAGFTQAGEQWVICFHDWEKFHSPELVEAFREGRAGGVAEARAKVAEFGG